MENKPSTSWDPNAPETEQDGIQAEALRRLKVRQLSKARPVQTPVLSQLQNDTPAKTASPFADKPPTYR